MSTSALITDPRFWASFIHDEDAGRRIVGELCDWSAFLEVLGERERA
jgi:hypothetical protein